MIRKAGRPFRCTANHPVEATSPTKGSGKSAPARSECDQGIHSLPVTDITGEESGSNASDESWERRECANCRLCADARQREALELSGNIVEVRPPLRPQFDRSLGTEFSTLTSPASEADKEDGPGVGSGFQVSDLFSDETEGGEQVQNTNAAVAPLERAERLEDALPPPFSTRPPMSWKKPAELSTERQFVAKKATFAQDTKAAHDNAVEKDTVAPSEVEDAISPPHDKAVEKDTVAPSEVEDAISPLSPTHPFMMWKRPPGMRTTWTFRTYGREVTEDRTEATEREDAIEPQLIGSPQKCGRTLQGEAMGAEEDEITRQQEITSIDGGEDDECIAAWCVTRPNEAIMVIETVAIEEII